MHYAQIFYKKTLILAQTMTVSVNQRLLTFRPVFIAFELNKKSLNVASVITFD